MLYSSVSTIGNNVLLDTLLGCQTNKLKPSTNLQYEQFLSQNIAQLEESASPSPERGFKTCMHT